MPHRSPVGRGPRRRLYLCAHRTGGSTGLEDDHADAVLMAFDDDHLARRRKWGNTPRMHRTAPNRLVSNTSTRRAMSVSSADRNHKTAALFTSTSTSPVPS